jgi:hypothetical protein
LVFIDKLKHPPSPPQGGNVKVKIPNAITLNEVFDEVDWILEKSYAGLILQAE